VYNVVVLLSESTGLSVIMSDSDTASIYMESCVGNQQQDKLQNDRAMHQARTLLIAPTQFEYQILHAAGVGRQCEKGNAIGMEGAEVGAVRLICSGPADGVLHTLEKFGRSYDLIILVGIAGSLDRNVSVGSAWVGSYIVDKWGHRWRCTWPATEDSGAVGVSMTTILGSDEIIRTQTDKAEAKHEMRANIVDTESHLLAAWIASLAAETAETSTRSIPRFGVIRGISDGADDDLPKGIEDWIDKNGKVRRLYAGLNLISHPRMIGKVRMLAKHSEVAMRRVVDILTQFGCIQT